MSGTSCPSCDAPAPSGARRCERCGYRFLEDGSSTSPGLPGRPLLAVAGLAVVVIAVVAVLATGGEGDDSRAEPVAATRGERLQVISEKPLSTRAAEAAIEEIYVALRDDDTASVRCSAREAKPAHSVRRCEIDYPHGGHRRVVLLTNARGNEVLSKP